jgi:hypothetical protein
MGLGQGAPRHHLMAANASACHLRCIFGTI